MKEKPLPGVKYQRDISLYPESNENVLQFEHNNVALKFFKGHKATPCKAASRFVCMVYISGTTTVA
jgi:hypothetical protein